ncbi:GNAT family N-acetyltransferase [Streptomyces sp. NPDC008150]|uniref:GNAT family N-acetyltransferase n=1 Tax=Streptomyces sp. NPDC008150 TaxID=3364816 RepID=UPI0036EA6BE8
MTLRPHTARVVSTGELGLAALGELHAFLDAAFDGGFGDDDWAHALGGTHVLLSDERGLAAHGCVVPREVEHRGRVLRTGYVEAVAVRPGSRRGGLGALVMAELEAVLDDRYELGALSASDEGAHLYRSRGWQLWAGQVHAHGPEGPVRLSDEEDSTFVRPTPGAPLDPAHPLVFDWREGDVL